MQAVALTIAGSDPSGGAGIQADLKTFHQFGVYGEAVITLLTVQNTLRVSRVETVAPDLVRQQIEAVLQDIPPGAAKTGALGNRDIVEAVAALAADFDFPLVVDPVMISKHGARLMGEDARDSIERLLLPVSFLITPNLPEAAVLSGIAVENVDDMREAARRLCGKGARSVLVKGGHLAESAMDILLHEGAWYEFPAPRIETPNTHGTGCTYSAAITAGLASGRKLPDAVARAKRYIAAAIQNSPGLGHGTGPVQHQASPD
ncbi:MAG TPA: bifunctional hydroxymethylpyrimidine kinase/phosphomethylpyrimidine kinase [Bryobacteraceae bacterium]|nr:bifunctional hydroxymethylpyrimidine kinase/phosphomethylpyrimidine kinase [Bryobacteraceae bacterium]